MSDSPFRTAPPRQETRVAVELPVLEVPASAPEKVEVGSSVRGVVEQQDRARTVAERPVASTERAG
ncbi:MAG: hypothetical protein M3Y49_15550, partial [Actinomycetota bacterium]|nr:hypothetical protein [Actinomycetota bacterium]